MHSSFVPSIMGDDRTHRLHPNMKKNVIDIGSTNLLCVFSIFWNVASNNFQQSYHKKTAKIVKFTFKSPFFLIKSP